MAYSHATTAIMFWVNLLNESLFFFYWKSPLRLIFHKSYGTCRKYYSGIWKCFNNKRCNYGSFDGLKICRIMCYHKPNINIVWRMERLGKCLQNDRIIYGQRNALIFVVTEQFRWPVRHIVRWFRSMVRMQPSVDILWQWIIYIWW